jgi:hypothetical protein
MGEPKKRRKKVASPLASLDVAGTVANLVLQAANRKTEIEALLVMNGHKPGDVVPGSQAKLADDEVTVVIEDGRPVFPTYQETISAYDEQIERLRAAYEPVWPAVERVIERRRVQVEAEG